jgi:hypothetical protein
MSRRGTGDPALSHVLKSLSLVVFGICTLAQAQVTYTGTTTDDSFLATGSPANPLGTDLTADNFGAAGVLAIAPAASVKGEFQTVLKFNLADATSLFDATYGSNWIISGISLAFASNVGTNGDQPQNQIFNAVSGGNFVIEWMADDDWSGGTGRPMAPTTDGVTYDSLSNLLAEAHEPLCTNTYTPPGNNVYVTWPLPLNADLVTNLMAGGPVSFRLYAADEQISYLFNSQNFGNGNQPLLNLTAIPLLKIVSGCFTNGVFHLVGLGGTNAPYLVQASADLSATNWQTIGTATANDSGVIQFDDPNAVSQPRQFYRLSQ